MRIVRGPLNVYIIRGLPGSGKSTIAQALAGATGVIVSADDFFIENGKYKFDGIKLGKAHESCRLKFVEALEKQISRVVVDNTNITKDWYKFYEDTAKSLGYQVAVLCVHTDLTDAQLAKRNKHGCPEQTIKKMRERFEN